MAVLVHLFPQPAGDSGEIPVGHAAVYIEFLLHVMEHLGTVGIAQSVRREVAEGTARPVAVLQAALAVIGNLHAQILLVQLCPRGRDLLCRQGARNELLLDLVPHHNVQAVGQLIGLGADEAGLHLVHSAVELLRSHISQLCGEEFLHLGIDGPDKGAGTADEVLVEAGLALVHAHGHTAGQAGVLQVIPDAQLIQGMAALVENGVHRGGHIVQVVVGGDADILVVELQRKGVFGLTQAAVAPVQTHDLHEIVRKRLLLLDRIFQMQEAVIDLGLLADGPDEGHQTLAQGVKEHVQLLGVHAPLILVQQGIIGRFFRIIIARELPVILHQLLQDGAEGGKVVFFLGLVPDITGAVGQLAVCHILLGGDAGELPAAAAQLLHLAAVEGVQRLPPGIEFLHQCKGLGGGHQLLQFTGQNAQSHTPALGRVLGGHGHSVQIQAVGGAVVGVQLLLQGLQRPQLLILFHWVFLLFQFLVGNAGSFQKKRFRATGSGSGISNV